MTLFVSFKHLAGSMSLADFKAKLNDTVGRSFIEDLYEGSSRFSKLEWIDATSEDYAKAYEFCAEVIGFSEGEPLFEVELHA